MDTLREVFDSLRNHIRSRLGNPLYGAYVVAWLAINFRLLLVLIGDGGWREKIAYIDATLYPTQWHWAWYGVSYPLLVAVAFVVFAPYAQRWVSVYTQTKEKATIEALLKVAGETPMGPEAADALRKSLLSERQRRVESERRFRAEIEELNAQLDEASKATHSTEYAARAVSGEGDETEAVVPPSGRLKLFEFDFTGGGNSVSQLLHAGLTKSQARALYDIRNEAEFDSEGLAFHMGLKDRFRAEVVLDQLRELNLVQRAQSEGMFRIAYFGRS